MKQKLLFLAIAIVGIGGYIFYHQKNQQSRIITNFIPDNTLVLLETNEISTVKNKIIPRIPLLSQASLQYQVFKNIGLKDKDIHNLILKKTLYFALIPEGKNQLSFVSYLPLSSDDEDFIKKLASLSQNTNGKRIITHTTQGFKVSEVINENAKSIFAFIIQDNFLIFSSSSLAVEEAVLHKKNVWINTLKLNSINFDANLIFTNTHFNQSAISSFLRNITTEKTNNIISLFPETYQWLKPEANAIEAVSNNIKTELFEGQVPSDIKCFNMIPNSCSYLLNLTFSNREKIVKKIEENIDNDKIINSLREKASDKFDFKFTNIYNHIEGEITLCSFDNSEQSTQNKVLIIKHKGLLNPLKVIARNVAEQSEDDIFSVQYGSFLITSLGIKEFPSLLFGSIYGGFEECYFTEYKDYIILTSNLPMMQDYLVNISKGNVWSNSAKQKSIINKCVPANLTMITETSKALKGLKKVVNNQWAAKIISYENTLLRVQAEILQQNATEGRLVLLRNIEPVKTTKKFSNKWIKLGGMPIEASTEPMYLINPLNKNAQILVQSKDEILHLYENGKQIWTYQLVGKIVGGIKYVNFSKKNEQQLLVVTNHKIFILTRKEKGFNITASKNFQGFNLNNFNVFENEQDKSQNLTLVSENGESFKLNKESLIFSPVFIRVQTSETLAPMPSIIIKGTEYAIILEKSGKLTLQNAKGKIAAGFPISLGGIFNAPPHLESVNKNIVIRTLSEKGELYKISLEGKILEKRQLFRPDNEAKFSLSVDERSTDWVLMRTNGKEVIVMDKNEQEMFAVKDLNFGKKVLKYYNLGIAGKYFAINNGYETYNFYNENGESIGGLPITSQSHPSLSYSDSYKKILMNITTPTSIETWSVKIK